MVERSFQAHTKPGWTKAGNRQTTPAASRKSKRRMAPSLLFFLAGASLLVGGANATSLYGFFLGSPGCSVKVYRKPTGPIDTLRDETNSRGKWNINTLNYSPPSNSGETLYVLGGWNLDGTARTFIVLPDPNTLDLHLDKHTACITNVNDSSHISAALYAVYWIHGFAPETAAVDTHFNAYWFYDDIHVPFDTLQAIQGESATIRLEKLLRTSVGDSVFYRSIPFTISKVRFDAQLVRDTVYFTRDSVEFRTRDIGIEALMVPDTVDSGDFVTPQALLLNLGEVTVTDTVVMHLVGAGYGSRQEFELAPSNDTAVDFDSLQMLSPGLNVFVCSLPPDYGPGNDVRYDTTFVRGYVSGIVGENQNQTVRVLPAVLRAPLDLRRVEGDLYDVLGRPVSSPRLEAGIYYLVTPERKRKLVVVN